MGTFRPSFLFRPAFGATLFTVSWRLGGGEDPKQIGFWAEPSASPGSVGAPLFAEIFERTIDGLLKSEAVFVEGVERTEEGPVPTDGALVKGTDVFVGGKSRFMVSIDVRMTVICSASDDGGLITLSRDGISAGLLVSVPFYTGFI